MKSQTVKTIGGVMSAVALISGGAGVAQAATIEPAAAAPASATTLAAADVADTEAPARAVEGTFSYTQDAVSSNAEISGVFCKAAATLCASLPTYGCEAVKAAAVTVAGPNASFTATVDELAGEEEATSYVMACSCATNVAGGGAIANAEVEGVSLETLVQMACAYVGTCLMPPLFGLLAQHISVSLLPAYLLVILVLMAVMHESLIRKIAKAKQAA